MKFVIMTLTLVLILGNACDATRSRRSVAGWFVDYFVEGLLDMAMTGDEHTFAYTMYKSYRGHDGCFERLLCELGVRLREFQGSTRMLSYIGNYVPPSYKNVIETLKQASQGTSCDDIGNPSLQTSIRQPTDCLKATLFIIIHLVQVPTVFWLPSGFPSRKRIK